MDLLPKDQEIEVTIILTKGDIDDILNDYPDNYGMIWDDIKDQIIGKLIMDIFLTLVTIGLIIYLISILLDML